MRSDAEIDRDHEGMNKACERRDHGCTYPTCNCDRARRIIPNVRGVGGPKIAPLMDPARVRELQAAALARKDALLRRAMEALLRGHDLYANGPYLRDSITAAISAELKEPK
jgi:hypothetical protein